eukprot:TRINITY_DN2354_c0_g1_i2.p1 TRINITY_DN2354_c0_g1~~TRINITY_DN2354_c0_g1_i2.p1  ORF type:complete len:371 (+),score=85.91 TRINITY_DN2354_c0_g1_i2:458-1570(+)
MEVLNDMIKFLERDGNVAIHDATNSSKERRAQISEKLASHKRISVLWIESICNDKNLLEENIKLKAFSPDYKNMTEENALADFKKRLSKYEETYQTLDDSDKDKSFIKLINVGQEIHTNKIHGYLASHVVTFLMNHHVGVRPIWATRHGESMANTMGLLGGNSELSPEGHRYAKALSKFAELHVMKPVKPCVLWTSTLIRTQQTAQYLKHLIPHTKQLSCLNEIYAGACEGMTYKQIEENMPQEYEARSKDKLRYRYPDGGESYMDIINRIKPVVIELERLTDPVFIISHQAVLRTLIGYYVNSPKFQLPHFDVPLHTVFCLTPTPHGCREVRYSIDLDKFDNGEEVFWNTEERFHTSNASHDNDVLTNH